MEYVLVHWQWFAAALIVVLLLLLYRQVLRLFGVIMVPDDGIGVVTKKFVLLGKRRRLPDGRIIALNGEAGFQADTLAPGLHVGLWPWQYTVAIVPFFTVPQGKVGCVEACDGKPLPSGRIVAREISCDSFQDARAFLTNDGERGPQMAVIPPGTYRINSLLFTVNLADAVVVPPGKIGVIEARDGKPLPAGRVIARQVDCNSFQDASAFVACGGERGPQASLIAPGTYRINPFMFLVQLADAVDIEDNKVGVVTTREGPRSAPVRLPGPCSRVRRCSSTARATRAYKSRYCSQAGISSTRALRRSRPST